MTTSSLYKLILYLIISTWAIFMVYHPGLSGGFVFDDFSNIVQLPGVAMQELSWNSLKSSALSMDNRPISRASFGLNFLVSGFDPYYFKIVNLAIHCINAVLLFYFMLLLLNQKIGANKSSDYGSRTILIAAAISLAWALHPVNLTNVLYVVQRMNSLSALFVLAGMVSYIKGRMALDESPSRGWLLIASSIFVFLPLAWYSKENGALLPLFLFLLELTIFRFSTSQKKQRNGLYLFYTLFLLIPALLALIYMLQHTGQFNSGYGNRHFSLAERLLTEPRVIWIYIRMILLPTPSVFGLFHDDIAVSTSFTDPMVTIPALVGLAGLFTFAVYSIIRMPILAFGLLFFFSGHVMESTFIPLELAFEHRNYLPSIGLLLPVFYYLGYAGEHSQYAKIRTAAIMTFILLYALQTHFWAWQWSDNEQLYLTNVQYHPNSPRANYEAGKIFGQRLERGQGNPQVNYLEAIKYFEQSTALRDNTTSGLFGAILASIDSNQVIKPAWIDELEDRLRNQPLEQVNILWLDKLTDCVSQRICRKEDLQVPRLVNAAMGNQKANRIIKAILSSILAKYMYQVEREKDKTLILARKSVLLIPSNPSYHLNLAKYLIWAGKLDEAQKTLLTTKRIDVYNQHTIEITRLLESLNK
ncbi:hypothetical protein ACFL2N_01755 [Pseudomonadota bacterium]